MLTVIKADHGSYPVGIAGVQRGGKHQYIHDDGDGSDTVFAHIVQHGPVEHQVYDAGDQSSRHLRAAVCSCLHQRFEAMSGSDKVQQLAAIGKQQRSHHGSHRVSQAGGNGSARNAHLEYLNKQVVEQDIEHTAGDGGEHRQGGTSTGNHVQSKVVHQQNRYREQQVTAQVSVAVVKHLLGKTHTGKDFVHQGIAEQ